MTPLDYSCSHFDVASNFMCRALPGERCNWPDGSGGGKEDAQFHPERIEAAAAMDSDAGAAPEEEAFDRAADAALSGDEPEKTHGVTGDASIG